MKSFSIITFALLFSIRIVSAQTMPSLQSINLKLSTDNPVPGQQVTITAESYDANLNSASIVWKLNGAIFQKGTGITTIQVQAPTIGKKLNISITANVADGRELENSLSLGSGSIDIIIENDGYVPPFFSGKIPLSYQNTYRIIAIPHLASASGIEYDPKTLIYEWTKDSKSVQEQNGYGKQVLTLTEDIIPRQRTINLRVTSRDGNAKAEKIIFIEAQGPKITFYNNDSLYGPLYNRALGDKVILGKSRELSVLAVPYGFNKPNDGVGNLSFTWLVNSIEQTALLASQSIVLRAPSDTTGSSNIQLQVKNGREILQGSENGFSTIYSAKAIDTNNNSLNNSNGI